MATVQELSDALVKADAAGDTAGAKVLADTIRQQQSLGAKLPGDTPPAQPQQPWAQSAPSQALSGINEGMAGTLGFPVDAVNSVLRAGAAGLHAMGGPDIQLPTNPIGGSQSIQSLMGAAITPPTSDVTGQMVRRIGQDVGASAVPIMGAAAAADRPLANAAINLGTTLMGGTGAAVANQAAPNNKLADFAGEMIGQGIGAGATGLLGRLITPNPIDTSTPAGAERRSLNDIMQQNGVDLTAGQQTGNRTLKYAESELGGSDASGAMQRQQQQFTQAALRKAGVNAPLATPEVMNEAFNSVGQRFNDLAANNSIVPDRQLGADLRNVWTDYQNVAGSDVKPIVGNSIQDVANWAQNGVISGDQYQALRSRLGRAMRSTTSPELKGAIGDLQDAIDGAMERSMAQANPDALPEWQQARRDYSNLMTLTKASNGAGESAAQGVISPAKLRQAAAGWNSKAYVRGQGDFADLARAGVGTMTPLPQSGTAPRAMMRAIPTALGAVLGTAGGGIGPIVGAVAGSLAPAAAGKLLMSPLAQRYLANQLLARGAMSGTAAVPLLTDLIHQAGSQ